MASEITLSPEQNALNSMERLTAEVRRGTPHEVTDLKGMLVWGWHVVDILAYMRLQPARDSFDPWMQDYLHKGEPILNVERDSQWEAVRHLGLLELIDMFSEVNLPILKPDFYQGWQDRTVRCHELREQIAGIVGSSITGEQRKGLLFLLAAYNRLFHISAAVSLNVSEIWKSLPAIFDFIELLIDPAWSMSATFMQLLQKCRKAI